MKKSKYAQLWRYIANCGKETITLSFEQICEISGASIDHSFLRNKKELTEYGYEVKKIFLKERKVKFEKCRTAL